MKRVSVFIPAALAAICSACAPVLQVPANRSPDVSVEVANVNLEKTPDGTFYVVRAVVEEHGVAPAQLASAQVVLVSGQTPQQPIDRTADVQSVELLTGGVKTFEWTIPQPSGAAPTSVQLNVSFAPLQSEQTSTASGKADLPRAPSSQVVTLEGVVKDQSGNPVPGAQVEVVEQFDTAITDQHGRFSFDDLAPGTLTLRASKGGFIGAEQDATVSSDATVDLVISEVEP